MSYMMSFSPLIYYVDSVYVHIYALIFIINNIGFEDPGTH